MEFDFNNQDLLYTLAYECESRFNELLQALQSAKPEGSIAELCCEYQQRFAIWTAYLGVFARKSQCLDTRLRNFPDLQDLVARLLDILYRSLLQIIAGIENSRETEMALSSDKEGANEVSRIQKAALETIDDTLTRLNRLGATIRQSSSSRLDLRVSKFAAGQNMDPFTYLCTNAIQALYPGAHQSLKEYLSESMTARYANMLYSNSRRADLRARRTNLPTIEEIPSEKTQTNSPVNPPAKKITSPAMSFLRIEPYAPSTSDLSSVDIRQIKIGSSQQVDVSTKHHKTSSIKIKLGYYPRMPSTEAGYNVFPCQWCGESLNKKQLSETGWRQHVDGDLKPYICLYEECLDAHPAFKTFNEWHKHMEFHDWRWYQKVYLTSSWICPLCGSSENAYTSPQALYSHLTERHSEDLKNEQLEAIARQSKIEQSRAWDDCLLCCFTIEGGKDEDWSVILNRQKSQQKQEAIKSARKNIEMTSPGPPSSDFDSWDTSSDSEDTISHQHREQRGDRSIVVARHIAQHLHMLMGLTLRFETLQNEGGGLDEDFKSNSADIDDEHSAASGDTRDLGDSTMQDSNDENIKASITSPEGDILKYNTLEADWEHAPRQLEGSEGKIYTNPDNVTQWLTELDDPSRLTSNIALAGEMKAAGQFQNRPSTTAMLPLMSIQTPGSLQYSNGTPIKVEITGTIKGFFLADGEWTCYRRNYMTCACSYSLQPHYAETEIHFIPPGTTQSFQVYGLYISISAVVADNDQSIELVQHTPKRDKGPTSKPKKVLLAPKNSIPPHHASIYQDAYGYSSGQSQGVGQPTTEHTFKYIQFKQATQNNGKRRAAQQYYHLIVELWADLGSQTPEKFIKIAYRKSEKIIVRGRSPGHYIRTEGPHALEKRNGG